MDWQQRLVSSNGNNDDDGAGGVHGMAESALKSANAAHCLPNPAILDECIGLIGPSSATIDGAGEDGQTEQCQIGGSALAQQQQNGQNGKDKGGEEEEEERAAREMGEQQQQEQQCCNQTPPTTTMMTIASRSRATTACRSFGAESAVSNADRGPKVAKFCDFWEQVNLGNGFRILGRLIGTYPLAFLISSIILASLSVGMYKLEVRDRVRDGYTPATSLARYETDVLKEFLGSTGDPLLTTVMLRARDGGSMHRLRWLDQTVQLHNFLRRNISADLNGESIHYSDICGPFCDANIVINYFRDSLHSQLVRKKSGKKPSSALNLTYPIAHVNGFELHLERNFYGVRLIRDEEHLVAKGEDGGVTIKMVVNGTTGGGGELVEQRQQRERRDPEVEELNGITEIAHIEAVMMSFRADISHPLDEAKMARWEMCVYEFSRHFNNSLVEMLVIGSEIVDHEMAAEAEKTVPYFVMGFFFMFGFVVYTLLIGAFFYGVMDQAKPLLALGVSLCPVLAITSTFGVLTIAGHRTNSVMLIMPFLICGIGVNDAFLMTHAWNRCAHQQLAVHKRLGLVFEEVGPSITITTLTNVVTFSIGALTPTPEISLFCLATAVALGFAYIYTLMLFAPMIYFASLVEDRQATNCSPEWTHRVRQRLNIIFTRLAHLYCDILTNRLFGTVLLVGVLVYWYFALAGTLNIHAKLDTEKILPRSSPLLEPHRLISHMVWTEYYPVTILVNNPVDIRFTAPLARFNAMLAEFEELKLCKGKKFTILWLRDYIEYCQLAALYDFDYFDGNSSSSEMHVDTAPRSETGLDYARLEQFLSSPFYKHYVPFLKFASDTKRPISGKDVEVPVAKFWLSVTFHNTSSWQDRIDLMQEWRAVADRYTDLNVTVWEVNAMFVDQMLSLKSLTLQTTFLTLLCMALVCAIFIQNPLSVASASGAIGSISIGVIGYLSWWHLNLDPVSLCAVLMSIGMSVDFTAHVSYHFQLSHKREIQNGQIVKTPLKQPREKLYNAVQAIAWPMSQAGLSTVICVLPLIFLQNYIPLVFVKTISLVAIWGLFHGLVLLPAFLAALPPRWLELNCYRMAVQRLQQMGEQQQLKQTSGSELLLRKAKMLEGGEGEEKKEGGNNKQMRQEEKRSRSNLPAPLRWSYLQGRRREEADNLLLHSTINCNNNQQNIDNRLLPPPSLDVLGAGGEMEQPQPSLSRLLLAADSSPV